MACSIIQVNILSNVGYFQHYPPSPMEVRLVVQLLLTYHICLIFALNNGAKLYTYPYLFLCVESDTQLLNFRFLGLDYGSCF